MKRFIVLALLLLGSLALSGCTLIGAGIGAATPRFSPAPEVVQGDSVRVTTSDGETASGTVARASSTEIVLGDGRTISIDDVRKVERRSSNLALGAAIGGIVDTVCVATVLVVGAVALTHLSYSNLNFSGEM